MQKRAELGPSRATFRCSKLSFRQHLMFLTIKDSSKLSLYIKIIHRFQVYRQTLWEKSRFGEKWAFLNQCTSVTLYVSNHKIRDASNISKYRLLQRWNRFINAPNPWKYQTRTATTDLWEKRGKGIKCSSCQLESYRMMQVRFGGWEQEDSPNKNLITQQQHNNRAKERST